VKRIGFTEEQIVGVLKEAEAGTKVSDLCRRYGVSGATFYTWRSKYAGLDISEMRRLRRLEDENRQLKTLVAHQALDIMALKDALAKEDHGQALSSESELYEGPKHTDDRDASHQTVSATFGPKKESRIYRDAAEVPNGARSEGLGLFVLEPTAGTLQRRAKARGASGIRQQRSRSRYKQWIRNNAFTIVVVLSLLLIAWHIVKP
jgi:putative transposase